MMLLNVVKWIKLRLEEIIGANLPLYFKCTGKGSLLMIMFLGRGSRDMLELSESILDLGYIGDVAIEEE